MLVRNMLTYLDGSIEICTSRSVKPNPAGWTYGQACDKARVTSGGEGARK